MQTRFVDSCDHLVAHFDVERDFFLGGNCFGLFAFFAGSFGENFVELLLLFLRGFGHDFFVFVLGPRSLPA